MGSMPRSLSFDQLAERAPLLFWLARASGADCDPIDVQQTRGHPKHQEDDEKNRPGLEPGIDLPADEGCDDNCRYEFDERPKTEVGCSKGLTLSLRSEERRVGKEC